MNLRYLVGPVPPDRARSWKPFRERGDCLTFSAADGADILFSPGECWEALVARLPSGFAPDFVLLDLGYTTVPDALWDAPIPLLAWAPDWQLQWHFLRRALPLCSLVFTDLPGVEVMGKAGIEQAMPLNLFGPQGLFTDPLPEPLPPRDIDVLFVGNLNPAVQGDRLPWLARIARLSERWRVMIAQGVHGEEYRRMLLRSRIVFNRSVKGEWNLRVGEACSSGALLFTEASNREMQGVWTHDVDCVFYAEDNLESLLEYYLTHEDTRVAVAEAGRTKARAFTFAREWSKGLQAIEQEWDGITARHRSRPTLSAADRLSLRMWQALGAADAGDPTLLPALDATVTDMPVSLVCARGILRAIASRDDEGRLDPRALQALAGNLHQALSREPGHALAALNLVETLLALNQRELAMQGARRLLDLLAREPLSRDMTETPRFPPGFDHFRVGWEEAAWKNVGSPVREAEAKAGLVRWRLHALLAEWTGESGHYHEAALAGPPVASARAALGCALAREGRLADAIPHLTHALERNPFDLRAARALYQALLDHGAHDPAARVAHDRRLLHRAAPSLVPAEDWFAERQGKLTSIIVLCRNEVDFSRLCLESVRRHTNTPYELILIDNGSKDATPSLLDDVKRWREPNRVHVIRNEENKGFPAGCNQGTALAGGEYLLFLNNDVIVTAGWLERLLACAGSDSRIGMVGAVSNYTAPPQLVEADYDDLSGLDAFADRRRRAFAGRALEAEILKGFCLLAAREAIMQVGGFDERYGLGFFDDDDLSLRVRLAGFRLVVALDVFIHHFGSRTFASLGIDTGKQLEENLAVFRAKWGDEHASRFRLPESGAPRPDVVVPIALPRSRTVSLCVIAKNEEANIEACLDSARDLVDEVIVVDTGSTDRTKELALAKGAKVFDFPWEDSFSKARNACLQYATSAWIFWLDADDRVDAENREKLRALFASLPEDGNVGYSMKCRCLPDPVTNLVTVVDHIRLFRNHPKIRWRYRIHEQILGAVKESGGEVRFVDIAVRHTGYVDPALRQRKLQRDLRLLQMEYGEQPHDPFTLFNLGATYVELGRHAEAVPLLRESLERSHPKDSIVRKLYSLLVSCHLHQNEKDEAIRLCTRGQAVCPDDPELLLLEGMIRFETRDMHGAKAALVRLLGTETGPHFASVADGLRTYRGRHQLALVCRALGEFHEAEGLWRQAVTEAPGFLHAWLGLASLYLDAGRYDDLEQVAEQLDALPQGALEAALLRGKALFAQRAFPGARAHLESALARWPEAVSLWEVYSFTLLEEGRDERAAEQVLVKLLTLDPDNAGAGQNLRVLRSRMEQ